MWCCRQLTGLSYPELGREFERDHTTVISACQSYVRRTTALERVRLLLQCAWWPERYVTPQPLRDDATDIKVYGLPRCRLCDNTGYQGGHYCFRHCRAEYDYLKPPASESG